MKKLAILKAIVVVVLTILVSVFSICRKAGFNGGLVRLEYPMRWLRHYLVGSGKAMEVPSWIVQEGTAAMKTAIAKAQIAAEDPCEGFDPYAGRYNKFLRPYCVYHSTLYAGEGFYGRPILFYLLGGFTFRLYWRNGQFMVSGKDHYDWHATRDREGNPQYFTSPLGSSKPIVLLVYFMGKLFGEEYFVTNGFPMGEAGISNRLWEDFKEVGAREFNSFFVNQPIELIDDIDLSSFPQEDDWGGYVVDVSDEDTDDEVRTVVTLCDGIVACVEEYDAYDNCLSQFYTTKEEVIKEYLK